MKNSLVGTNKKLMEKQVNLKIYQQHNIIQRTETKNEKRVREYWYIIKHTNIHKRKLKPENLKALKKNNSALQGNIKILLISYEKQWMPSGSEMI